MRRTLTATTPVGTFTTVSSRPYTFVAVVRFRPDHYCAPSLPVLAWSTSRAGAERLLQANTHKQTEPVGVFPVDGATSQ